MITRPLPPAYALNTPYGPNKVPASGRLPGFATSVPAGQWMGHSGKASWDPQAGPRYELHTWSGLPVSLAKPKLAMDPSDPSTWQRPYVFTR